MKRWLCVLAALALAVSCAGARAEEEKAIAALGYLGESFRWENAQTADLQLAEMAPVYAAPSEDAWRGARGKAAVSLLEPFTVLGYAPEDSRWRLIEYEISSKERRVGYILWDDQWPGSAVELSETRVAATLKRDAVLTDDPWASGRAMATLPEGGSVTLLGSAKGGWLYVETSVDGQAARGFIPMETAALPEPEPLPEVMAGMEGVWGFYGGAEVLADGVILTADGDLTFCHEEFYMESPPEHLTADNEHPATYAVYAKLPGDERFWSDYVFVFRQEESSQVYGLHFFPEEDGEPERMHIEYGPSGGFYVRYETEPVIE